MKKIFAWVVLFCVVATPLKSATVYSPASSIRANKTVPNEIFLKKIAALNIKDLQKLAGRKFSLKEKIAFLLLKHKLKHKSGGTGEGQGQTSFILGIAAITLLVIGIFVPYALIGSLVASILAIVFGSLVKRKDPSDNKARIGKLLGWLTIGLLALLLLAALFLVALWGALVFI